jgi:hypothetical protein
MKCGPVAKSLTEAQRETAERLDAQVDQFDDDPDDPHTRVAEAQQLRGIPAASKYAAGSAIAGTRPGENLGLFDDEE